MQAYNEVTLLSFSRVQIILARNYRRSALEYILSTQVSIFKGSSSHMWGLRVVSQLKVVIYWWRWGLIFIHNLIDSKSTWKKEESHPQMTRTPSMAFLELCEYSYEWLWLIESYLQNSKTLGLGHKVMVAMWSHFKQSASRLGKSVWTPLATISDDLYGLYLESHNS